MTWNIIVASSDADQLDELLNGAQEIALKLKPRVPATVRIATSVEECEKKRNAQTGLLIVAASLPRSRAGADDDHEPGLRHIESLARQAAAPPCIVVSDRIELYRAIQGLQRCELLVVDATTDYVEQCLQLARRLGIISDDGGETPGPARQPGAGIAGASAKTAAASAVDGSPAGAATRRAEKAKYALIEVDLPTDATFAQVHLEIHESGKVTRNPNKPLRLNKNELSQLIKDSQVLRENLSKWQQDPVRWKQHYDRWHHNYRSLGERVSRLLWGSQSFRECYYTSHGAAEGNVRVRFSLEQPWFDGLWEAISGEQDDRSLMLDKTIARRMIQQNQLSVFSSNAGQIEPDNGTLNVLFIKSNVPDGSIPQGPADPWWDRYWASVDAPLPELLHLDDEENVLRDLKRPPKRTRGGGGPRPDVHLDVLPLRSAPPGKEWSLAKMMDERLKSRRYDIVHFAGHALFAEGPNEDRRGYLVFSGYPVPRAVPISTVATWLARAGVQFVYLSCCRSSAASAALEFARNNIPMAMGFHWDLDDSKAPVFAREFYDELLDANLKVCPAVSKARLKLYNEHDRGDPIWASPVLIAQPMDWGLVEDVLKPVNGVPHPAARRTRPLKPAPPRLQSISAA